MKDLNLMNVILKIGKTHRDGFSKKQFKDGLLAYGMSENGVRSFMLSNMKKAGIMDNPRTGWWKLSEYGKTLNQIDKSLGAKILKMRKIRIGPKRGKRKRMHPVETNESTGKTIIAPSLLSSVNIAELIVEVKRVNPKADISKFAAML